MFIFKILAVVSFQLCLLIQESTARIKHFDEYIGKSDEKHCDCGMSEMSQFLTPRVIGGSTTRVYWLKYPFMVGLVYGGVIKCGASIIDTQHVLTAAHCIKVLKNSPCENCKIQIALNIRHTSEKLITVEISRYFIHPIYDGKGGKQMNDIAIIELEKPIYYTEGVKPICLAVDPKMSRAGTYVKVIGFGYTTPEGNRSTNLKEINLPVRTIDECRQKLKSIVLDTAICAGGSKGQDTCLGDSGGPMFYIDSDGRAFQVGIVSWGKNCGAESLPAVYTRINSFMHWIRNITANSPPCEKLHPPVVGHNVEDCGIPEVYCDGNSTECKSRKYTYSWMARIFYKNKYLGTGVLINRTDVLTSTCVIQPWRHLERRGIRIIIGMQSFTQSNSSESEEIECNVSSVHYHFLLNQVNLVMLRLDLEQRELTVLHRPLCMPDPEINRDRSGELLSIMFWKEKTRTKPKTQNVCGRYKTHRNRNTKKRQRKKKTTRTPKKQQNHSQEKEMILKTEIVSVVTRQCNLGEKEKKRVICVHLKKKQACHEPGAVLLNYVAGRFYIMGFVSPRTKQCSNFKKFLEISWNYKWIDYVRTNIHSIREIQMTTTKSAG